VQTFSSGLCAAFALAAMALSAAALTPAPARAELAPKSLQVCPFDKPEFVTDLGPGKDVTVP
jgi:hypothetical protein